MCASNPGLKLVVAGATLAALMMAACNRAPDPSAATIPPAPAAPGAQTAPADAATTAQADPAAAQAALAAQAQAAQSWEPSALDELLGPIALYPDALVGQILAASANPQEVLDAGNWLLDNHDLNGKELDAATEKLGFSPAVRALVQFPSVVDMMCSQLDWTKEVGQAFTADQNGVLDSIQRLRTQAAAVGNLQSTPQQKVEKKEEPGTNKEVIVVQPADPQVVYVPQYNPQVVYTTPPPAPVATTTTVVQEDNTGDMIAAGLIGFTAGIVLNEAFDDHDDYYPHWGGGAAYYPPPYRPVYPGYRPAGAYVRPPAYRYNYNNVYNDVHRGNNNVNINVDNDNYFNRVTNNQHAVSRKTAANADEWRGKTTYGGAQNRPGDRDVGNAANNRAASNQYRGGANEQRAARPADQRPRTDEYRGTGSKESRERNLSDQRTAGEYRGNANRDAAAERRATGANADRAGEHLSTGAARDNAERHVANTGGASTRQPRADRGFDAGGAGQGRANDNASSVARQGGGKSSGALSNVSRGSKEHAASQRGHQSAGNKARRGR